MISVILLMQLSTAAEVPHWYIRPDGSKQCQPATARKKTDLVAELKKAKIKYKSLKSISDGAMRMQVCGSPTGQLDAVEAPPSQAPALRRLGFVEKPVTLETGT